jgi:hypothetical protein
MMIAGHRLRRWQRNFFLRMHFPNSLTQKFSGWWKGRFLRTEDWEAA